MKRGELGDGKLLGAGVGTQIQGSERFTDTIGFGERPEIIDKSFALLRETQFHKIQETRCVAEGELCAFAREAECDEGRRNFRWRLECFARNFEDECSARVELGDDGKITVIARARLGRKAESDFRLNDDVYLVDDASEGEQLMKDGRRNVVGKIAVDADATAGSDGTEIGLENVAWDDSEIGEFLCEVAEARDERRVDFDGVDGSSGGEEKLSHLTMS